MVNKRIAIIPARGGSKRIPYKNIIDFFGKPLIDYTIEAALSTDLFDTVLVSTDDEDIAEIARESGAEVPFLRDQYTDDISPVSAGTLYGYKQYTEFSGKSYSSVCQLMPNCPLRTAESIRKAYKYFESHPHDFQISCFQYGWMNPWWAHRKEGDGWIPLFKSEMTERSQDLPTLYVPTGAIWIADAQAFQKSESFYGQDYKMYPLTWQEAIDIDDQEDLQMAKAVYVLKKNEETNINID